MPTFVEEQVVGKCRATSCTIVPSQCNKVRLKFINTTAKKKCAVCGETGAELFQRAKHFDPSPLGVGHLVCSRCDFMRHIESTVECEKKHLQYTMSMKLKV